MPVGDRDNTARSTLLASLVQIELPKMSGAVAAGIEREVPAYRADSTGRVHAEVKRGVVVAVETFCRALDVAEAGTSPELHDAFRRIGRLELQAGRSLDIIQSAYRTAERQVTDWVLSRCAEVGVGSALQAQIKQRISLFMEQLSQLSAEGYAEARADSNCFTRSYDNLLALVMGGRCAIDEIEAAAQPVGWRVPRHVRVLELATEEMASSTLLQAWTNAAMQHQILLGRYEGRLVAVCNANTTAADLALALPSGPVLVIGPAVGIGEAAVSARITQRVSRTQAGAGQEPILCDDHMLDILQDGAEQSMQILIFARLQPLLQLPIAKRVKLGRLLSAWLELGSLRANAPTILDKSRHTLRYQTMQLEQMFGDALADREARVQLILALRAALPQWELELAAATRRVPRKTSRPGRAKPSTI